MYIKFMCVCARTRVCTYACMYMYVCVYVYMGREIENVSVMHVLN